MFNKDKELPFVAIGNEELEQSEYIGKTILCNRCGKRHTVEYGERVLKDGTKVPSKMLGFVKCGKISYLVSLNEKDIRGSSTKGR